MFEIVTAPSLHHNLLEQECLVYNDLKFAALVSSTLSKHNTINYTNLYNKFLLQPHDINCKCIKVYFQDIHDSSIWQRNLKTLFCSDY